MRDGTLPQNIGVWHVYIKYTNIHTEDFLPKFQEDFQVPCRDDNFFKGK